MFPVMLKQELFSGLGLKKLASYMGGDHRSAIGTLAFLYQAVMGKNDHVMTDEEIVLAASFGSDGDKIVDWLLRSGFIVLVEPGTYRIKGAKDRITYISEVKNKRSAAGKAGAEKRWQNSKTIAKPKQNNSAINNSNRCDNIESVQHGSEASDGKSIAVRLGKVRLGEELNTDLTNVKSLSSGDDRTAPPKKPKPFECLAEIWNEHRGSLPGFKTWSPARSKAAEKAWRTCSDRSVFVAAAKNMAADDWCNGRNKNPNDSHASWRADFGYFLRSFAEWAERVPAKKSKRRDDWDNLPIIEAGQ